MSGYRPSAIKRRGRPKGATRAAIEARRSALIEIVEAQAPMTVRQVFYRATVEGLVEKSEAGYAAVQDDLAKLRRRGDVSYYDIADSTRFQCRPKTYASVEEALKNTARFYRKSLWSEANAYVEIWLEKDALSGVIYPVTSEHDVPLMVARGYASLSFLHGAADAISDLDVPAYIYHLGDYDPSGVNAGEKIEETLRDLAPECGNPPRAPRRHPVPDPRPRPPHAVRPRSQTADTRVSATSRWSWMRWHQKRFAAWFEPRSRNIFPETNSRY